MSEANKAVARRWFQEVWNERRAETIQELMHPQVKAHTPSGEIHGPAAWKQRFWDPFVGAFSDIKLDIEDLVAEGDRVVVRWQASMRHTGGHIGVPETGRALSFPGISWIVVRDGKLVEGWDGWDFTGMLVSIGGAQLHPALANQREAAR